MSPMLWPHHLPHVTIEVKPLDHVRGFALGGLHAHRPSECRPPRRASRAAAQAPGTITTTTNTSSTLPPCTSPSSIRRLGRLVSGPPQMDF